MNATPSPAPAPAATAPETGKRLPAKPDAPTGAPPSPAKAKKAVPPKAPKAAGTAKPAKAPAASPAPTAAPAETSTTARKVPAKKSKPTAAPAKPKAKLVRDSFTMPQADFDLIAALKDRSLGFKRPTKKSELLRAGLQVLAGLKAPELKAALERLAPLKTGRPKKDA